ncbi:lipopolysaccharide biosynthesis protein [Paenibacillus sp. SYP-B4298]|uniref:lipopolysaccharide biosynthesis protein n=1 Tax=Paenibacillus sp. SYP-B4298 TaxID=2996034 RepID=UPI0022DE94C2|nr:oligosaccharide flippase family protein [Paenibacillus sp. SYP-B4298]
MGSGIVRKSFVYFIGNLSSKFISVLLIPIYAFSVTAEELGRFDYSLTLANLVTPFMFFAIWEAILKFILSKENDRERIIYLSTSLCFSLVVSGLILLGLMLLFFLDARDFKEISYIALIIISTGLAQIWQYYARSMSRDLVYVYSGVISAIINLTLTLILLIGLHWGVDALYISFIVSQLSIMIIIEFKMGTLIKLKREYIKITELKKMLVYSIPMMLNLSVMWFFLGFGKYIIVNNISPSVNGLYAFANRLAFMIGVVGSVINMAVIENAITSVNDKKFGENFSKTIGNLFALFQSAILFFLPISYLFYYFIRNTPYFDSFEYIPWLLIYIITMTMSSNIGSALQAVNKTKYIFTTTIAGAIVTILISYLCINFLGIYAILIGQLLGAFTMMISRYFLVKKFLMFQVKWLPVNLLFCLFVFNSFVFINLSFLYTFFISLFSLIFLVIYNKRHIIQFVTRIKSIV